jgi:hypothetical protein
MKPGDSLELKVGEEVYVNASFWNTYAVGYAGMIGNDTFSLVIKEESHHPDRAYNLYYPTDCKEVTLHGGLFKIDRVNTKSILIRHVSQSKDS